MISSILKKLSGRHYRKYLKKCQPIIESINAIELEYQSLSDAQLRAKTAEFMKRNQERGESLDDLLPEAFAAVKSAARRMCGQSYDVCDHQLPWEMVHYDVQFIGGIALHENRIAEMATGEGKTLVSTCPLYLNALTGRNCQLVTVNDYLARRDSEWMGHLFRLLGLTVGCIQNSMDPQSRREMYACNITYGTASEFGFDYLRDNMAFSMADKSQGKLAFAIVDEVDSILIDEARTPLIISGAVEDSSELYKAINRLIPKLTPEVEEQEGDFTVDEKQRSIELTESGHEKVEGMLIEAGLLQKDDSLYAATNLGLLHHVHSGLRAHVLFQRDVEYIVQEGQVVLIDEHTGRTMPGRRLSEGLHQAIEAKEGVKIQSESQTLASTTFQNFFRIYDKLAGMTGTADTEAFEFRQIYGLDCVVIPTNVPMRRDDLNDLVYLTREEKFEAIIEDVRACIDSGAPVLVGTASVETSEELSHAFEKQKIDHKVLNAKYHEQEAEIIAQAGRPGVVTIATNMAGRGTDIVLGGNLEVELASQGETLDGATRERLTADWQARHDAVIEAGGLHILGTERHESRRIDNQLRGRSGRQGDPGVSRFYLSLEDNLMRIFASDRVKSFMQALGMERGEAIEHRMVTNAIEKAQRKVEGRNFDIRKQLLEYDDVANDQRQIIYRQRDELLSDDEIGETITAIREDVVNDVIDGFIAPMSVEEQWDILGLEKQLEAEFGLNLPVVQWLDEDDTLHEEPLRQRIVDAVQAAYDEKAEGIGPGMRQLEKQIMLQVLDTLWKEHLQVMDQLRQGIHLRAYANKNPKQEYKRESFALFEGLLQRLKYEVVRFLSNVQVQRSDEAAAIEQQRREAAAKQKMAFEHAEAGSAVAPAADAPPPAAPQPITRAQPKVGRNDPCPCGSGKKYKQCHGALS